VYGKKSFPVHVLAFSQSLPLIDQSERVHWDFLYPADGESHKNHRCLVEAWVLLSQNGCKPSLALTLTVRDAFLLNWIEKQITAYGLNIAILGHLPYDEMVSAYGKSSALIFPSISESFGLPLIEARQAGLPILASELDYVRDVCEPVQTFDPNSPTSIARAVRRFIGEVEIPLHPVSASEFITAVRAGLN
jgi:glycosyltransferase involved in cell wall biosynthesis